MTHEGAAPVFRYLKPERTKRKALVRLAHTPDLSCNVQVIGEGGENNLHAHEHLEGTWFVLGGRARFYTTGDELIAELGVHEGIVIPRGFPYWFESVGDDELEILQVEYRDAPEPDPAKFFDDRIDLMPKTQAVLEATERSRAAPAD